MEVELVLLTHGFKPSWWKIWNLRQKYGVAQVKLLQAPRTLSLGACLNLCVVESSGAILTKMDDDDYYGPHYLRDQVNALMFSGADVVGKLAHYMYIQGRNVSIQRFKGMEHRFHHMVIGSTIMAKRSVFDRHRFPELGRGEDTAFLRSVSDAGAKFTPPTDITTSSTGRVPATHGLLPTIGSFPRETSSSGATR